MSNVTIYHNNRCSKSRATLAIVEEKISNIEDLTVIAYLETPPSANELKSISEKLGFDSIRLLMRTNEAIYKELNLKDETDEQKLIDAMVANPKLIERPIVLANGQAKIGRPPESVLAII
jgi:arsenate reductase